MWRQELSGLGKIPVVQGETEVDAREEIPDYGKYLGKNDLLLSRTSQGVTAVLPLQNPA